jgi:hypothetical protein
MPDRTIKAGDTFPPITLTLSDEAGPINLTTAVEVTLRAKSSTHAITGTCSIVTAASGVVAYSPTTEETANPGTYEMECLIDWGESSGKDRYQTAPSDRTEQLVILENQAAV